MFLVRKSMTYSLLSVQIPAELAGDERIQILYRHRILASDAGTPRSQKVPKKLYAMSFRMLTLTPTPMTVHLVDKTIIHHISMPPSPYHDHPLENHLSIIPPYVSAQTYWLSHLIPSPYPCLMTTLHMKTSTGRIPSSGTLPLPVVWYRPSAARSWSSEIASGWSILLPRITKGVDLSSSMASRASSSAFDSERRSWSFASTRKTMPLTSGK